MLGDDETIEYLLSQPWPDSVFRPVGKRATHGSRWEVLARCPFWEQTVYQPFRDALRRPRTEVQPTQAGELRSSASGSAVMMASEAIGTWSLDLVCVGVDGTPCFITLACRGSVSTNTGGAGELQCGNSLWQKRRQLGDRVWCRTRRAQWSIHTLAFRPTLRPVHHVEFSHWYLHARRSPQKSAPICNVHSGQAQTPTRGASHGIGNELSCQYHVCVHIQSFEPHGRSDSREHPRFTRRS